MVSFRKLKQKTNKQEIKKRTCQSSQSQFHTALQKQQSATRANTGHSKLEAKPCICFQRTPHGKIASYLWTQ